VVTVPAGVILRRVSLLMSATTRLPSTSTARPHGLRKRAFGPRHRRCRPAGLASQRADTPAGVILRMALLAVSAT